MGEETIHGGLMGSLYNSNAVKPAPMRTAKFRNVHVDINVNGKDEEEIVEQWDDKQAIRRRQTTIYRALDAEFALAGGVGLNWNYDCKCWDIYTSHRKRQHENVQRPVFDFFFHERELSDIQRNIFMVAIQEMLAEANK